MKAAIIGLGIIGSEWAHHLERDGLLAACWNRSPVLHFPKFTNELTELPKLADIIHIAIADPPAVFSVLNKLLPHLSEKNLVIQSSTIDPLSSEDFSQQVKSKGAKYLEAPFTGSLPAAQKREVVYYAGGENATLELARPYLERLSKKILHIGTEPQACVLKLTMNLQIAAALEALSEALNTARVAGIPDQTFFEAFRLNASYSGVAALKEKKLQENNFTAQFSVKHMAKDIRLLTQSVNKKMPLLGLINEVMTAAENQGLGDEDICSLIKLL